MIKSFEEEHIGSPSRMYGTDLAPSFFQILSIASHVASGCAYIHSKQIIHGDLK